MAGPHVISYAVFNPTELRSVSLWTTINAIPAGNVPFAFSAQELCTDDVVLQVGRITPCRVSGNMPAATASMFVPLAGAEFAFAYGLEIRPCGILMLGGGARIEIATGRELEWALVAMPGAQVEALLMRSRTSALLRPGTVAYCRAGQAAWTRMVALMRDAQRVLDRTPAVFEVHAARRGLRAELLDAAFTVLAARGSKRFFIQS